MRRFRTLPFSIATCLFASMQFSASFACTTDVLALSHQPISITLCDLGSTQGTDGTEVLRISEHLQRGNTSIDHQTFSTVPNGLTSPQTIADIDLAKLGLPQHLHITVRLTSKGPQIEHAIALPGPQILR